MQPPKPAVAHGAVVETNASTNAVQVSVNPVWPRKQVLSKANAHRSRLGLTQKRRASARLQRCVDRLGSAMEVGGARLQRQALSVRKGCASAIRSWLLHRAAEAMPPALLEHRQIVAILSAQLLGVNRFALIRRRIVLSPITNAALASAKFRASTACLNREGGRTRAFWWCRGGPTITTIRLHLRRGARRYGWPTLRTTICHWIAPTTRYRPDLPLPFNTM